MMHPYLNDALRLFEQSEGKTDPSRKFIALEEALELVDLVLEDSSLPQPDRELAENLRHSNIRRLLSQLVGMRGIQFGDWFNYIDLLLMRREHEVKTILDEDSSLKEGYQAFVAIWKGELLEALEHAQKKGL
ncbi:hypothetical protein SCT_2760 [Sulfuricella sp. T08]|uniref:hypothetical protein n=1 Tax=Sulfuricella sp. T08 TaxID=1632857 RepID=UPI0006179B98|nr:hypothetical protein [Sulfuricella sp. T08]GAO37339.1 hypothetical protein SCT_2760 [Sulfuricella sp. T08]